MKKQVESKTVAVSHAEESGIQLDRERISCDGWNRDTNGLDGTRPCPEPLVNLFVWGLVLNPEGGGFARYDSRHV